MSLLAVKPGIYQVTLSEEVSMDIVHNGRYAHPDGTRRSECPGLRKSVRFELGGTSFFLQISGAASDSIAVAFGPLE